MAEWFAATDADLFGRLGLDISIATFGSPGTSHELHANGYLKKVLEFGNTKDAVFNHLGYLSLLDTFRVEHAGTERSITVKNVFGWAPAINFYQHDSALYDREMVALALSPFGQEYLDTGAKQQLVIDGFTQYFR